MITLVEFTKLFGAGTAKSSLTPSEEGNEAPSVQNAQELEKALDKLVTEYLWHAELDDACVAIQTFIDELNSIESQAQGL